MISRIGQALMILATTYLGLLTVVWPEEMVWGWLGRLTALTSAFVMGMVFHEWFEQRVASRVERKKKNGEA